MISSASGAEVSSKALIELQANLRSLSKNLKELYDVLCNNMSALSMDWRDEKYNEFEEGFRPSKELVLELSEKYADWANRYLPPRIEVIIKIEEASVTADGSLGGSASSSSATASSSVASSSSVAASSSAEADVSSSDKRPLTSKEKTEVFRRGIDRLNAKMRPKPDDSGFGQNERVRAWWMEDQKTR